MTLITENTEWRSLLPPQRKAIQHVRDVATHASIHARCRIRAILNRAAQDDHVYDDSVRSVQAHARIGLHFHPERLTRIGTSVAEGLLRSGIYKNQFETGLSSGSPSAFPGGERDLWENRLFGSAYHEPGASGCGRPKYGALAVLNHPDGPAPRFGSCYFLLHPRVSWRSTLTFGGSHEQHAPERTGTLDVPDPVMAPLLAQLEQGVGAFGLEHLTVARLLDQLTRGLSKPFTNPESHLLGRALDSFIEVQVHGEIRLDNDVERLVVDPAFADHPSGDMLTTISAKYHIPLCWHPGLTLAVADVPDVFRDYPVGPLAERIAPDGILNAATIGAMANSLERDPAAWKDWASHEDTLTQFRRLWHVLVLKGTPNPAPRTTPSSNAPDGRE